MPPCLCLRQHDPTSTISLLQVALRSWALVPLAPSTSQPYFISRVFLSSRRRSCQNPRSKITKRDYPTIDVLTEPPLVISTIDSSHSQAFPLLFGHHPPLQASPTSKHLGSVPRKHLSLYRARYKIRPNTRHFRRNSVLAKTVTLHRGVGAYAAGCP